MSGIVHIQLQYKIRPQLRPGMGQSQMYHIYTNSEHLYEYSCKGKILPEKYCQNLSNMTMLATIMQTNQYYIIMLKQEKSLPYETMCFSLPNQRNQQKKLLLQKPYMKRSKRNMTHMK